MTQGTDPGTSPSGDVLTTSEVPEEAYALGGPGAPAGSVVPLGTYVKTYLARVRGGDSGVLPVVAGLILISLVFQVLNSHFLTVENLMNLLQQGTWYMVLAMGIVFVLLLGEIDLSAGWVGLVGASIAAEMLASAHALPLGVIICISLLVCAAIGFVQGIIITRLGLPSFVVTLAGLLAWQGVVLKIIGQGGTVPINDHIFNDIESAYITNLGVSWIVVGVVVIGFALLIWRRDNRRRASGLIAPPVSLTGIKIVASAAAGVALVLLVNANRGVLAIAPIRGLPWFVIEVLGLLLIWSVLLNRTKFGRYVYAIGGNREAARRAGINTPWIRTLGFTLCSVNGGIAGLMIASKFQGMATTYDGSQLVLYSIAAAVIGGTSLFGGRGKIIHGIIGGLVVAGVVNGIALVGWQAYVQYIATGVVLATAVVVDALTHRRASATS